MSKQKAAAQAHLTELMAKTTDVIQLKVLMNKAAALSEKKESVIDIKHFLKMILKEQVWLRVPCQLRLAVGLVPLQLGS
ncbi:hypothetical protein [Pseudolactococcus piscium]|uniref:hypothetical protein n=1 Tax=Pseudolactococcus piscium TaxID=1364 RepID=UPI001E42BD43|nr:hypothetical protein [Lactococcus piscium]